MTRSALIALLICCFATPASAASSATIPTTNPQPRKSAAEVLRGVNAPAGFDMTLFAQPPEVNYPTCLAAAPGGGVVFVGIDDQGSLGRDADRGRIVRCVDRDGDGVADEITTFAKLDHPRGLHYDPATRALYVMHPPDLTRHFDDDNDGVADRSETLITGLWNEKMSTERGADHTTNGIRLGIDGWIYVAIGDFGAFDARGADGARLKLRGGGIVRIRTDGTGLEVFAHGTRNIYDVAIDPMMNVFTRDNTNDGGGWNDRLSFSPPTAYHGYPSRFKRFNDEIVDCMLDTGGGSPCGSLFLDEPEALPEPFGRAFYTVEWGQNRIDRHPLTPAGAGFKATTEKLMDLPRGTDIDADGSGRLYLSSWAGGNFRYSDENVGYVIRLTPKDNRPEPFPDFSDSTADELMANLGSASGVRREAAQRAILHQARQHQGKSMRPLTLASGVQSIAEGSGSLPTRVIGILTLQQLRREFANPTLIDLAKRDDSVREFALRALADRKGETNVPADPFVAALRDPNPRVRLVAAWGLGRLGHASAAGAVLPITADGDPLVAHVAVNSLVVLKAIDACLAAVNTADPAIAAGALRALQQIHDDATVEGLAARLLNTTDVELRSRIYRALCRLYFQEADWDGTGWWSTRPDTSGPYYQPVKWSGTPKVADLIHRGLTNARSDPKVVRSILIDAAAHKLDLPEARELFVNSALTDSTMAAPFIDALAGRKSLSAGEMSAMQAIVSSDAIAPAIRAKAIRMLGEELTDPASVEAAIDALAPVALADNPDADLAAALDSFIHNADQFRQVKVLARIALGDDADADGAGSKAGGKRRGAATRPSATLAATPAAKSAATSVRAAGPDAGRREVALATLITIADSALAKPDPRKRADAVVARAWDDAAALAPLLRAVARTKAERFGEQVRAQLKSPDATVAAAAKYAASTLDPAGANRVTVVSLGYDQAIAAAAKTEGDPTRGKQLFASQGCSACHTVSAEDPPKGPFLGGISTRYSRAELLESVLKPGAKIAQGFDTQWFKTKDDVLEGFVSRESGGDVELRNLTGAATVLKKTDIKSRGKRDTSMMPTNLADKLSPQELASLIAYLESLKADK